MDVLLSHQTIATFLQDFPAESRLGCLAAVAVIGINTVKGHCPSAAQLWEVANSMQCVPIKLIRHYADKASQPLSRLNTQKSADRAIRKASREETPRFTSSRCRKRSSGANKCHSSNRLSAHRDSSFAVKALPLSREKAPVLRTVENLPVPVSVFNGTEQSIADSMRESEVLSIAHNFLKDPLLSQWAQPPHDKIVSFGQEAELQVQKSQGPSAKLRNQFTQQA